MKYKTSRIYISSRCIFNGISVQYASCGQNLF